MLLRQQLEELKGLEGLEELETLEMVGRLENVGGVGNVEERWKPMALRLMQQSIDYCTASYCARYGKQPLPEPGSFMLLFQHRIFCR